MRGKLWLAGGPPDVSFRAFLRVGLVRLCRGAGLAGSIEGALLRSLIGEEGYAMGERGLYCLHA